MASTLILSARLPPAMREADAHALQRARVFVDTRAGALAEAGDIIQAINEGGIAADNIEGDLAELAAGTVSGRLGDDEVTAFKSVGTALEDLCAAQLVVGRPD